MSFHHTWAGGAKPLRDRPKWPLQSRLRLSQLQGIGVVVAFGLLIVSSPADAFKWHQCPTAPIPVYPSTLGATNAPFIHPGHDLTIILNADEVASTGGFSLFPGANRVSIVFDSLFGQPIALPAFGASATSTDVLTFTFPDTSHGAVAALAGPVSISVTANGHEVAQIDSADLVALPASTDVTSIVLGQTPDETVQAAVGANGDIWIPAHFHGEPMSMPTCPGNFIHPLQIEIGGGKVLGALPPVTDPLSRIRRVIGYLGDVVIGDYSFYGMLYPQHINLVHVAGTLGVSICRLNDAMDLVLRVQGDSSWSQCHLSPFRLAARNSHAISIRLIEAPLVPYSEQSTVAPLDSFGNSCDPAASPSMSPRDN